MARLSVGYIRQTIDPKGRMATQRHVIPSQFYILGLLLVRGLGPSI